MRFRYDAVANEKYNVDSIVHLAAESHVDRSIKDPFTFAKTNVMGTLTLLQAAKNHWESLPENLKANFFIIYPPTKFTGRWSLPNRKALIRPSLRQLHQSIITHTVRIFSWRQQNITHIHLIARLRHRAITLFVPITTHMDCLLL